MFVVRDFNWSDRSDGFMNLRLSLEYVTYWQIAKGDRESGPNLVGQRKRNFFAKIINFVVNTVFTATFLVEKRIDVQLFLHTTYYHELSTSSQFVLFAHDLTKNGPKKFHLLPGKITIRQIFICLKHIFFKTLNRSATINQCRNLENVKRVWKWQVKYKKDQIKQIFTELLMAKKSIYYLLYSIFDKISKWLLVFGCLSKLRIEEYFPIAPKDIPLRVRVIRVNRYSKIKHFPALNFVTLNRMKK